MPTQRKRKPRATRVHPVLRAAQVIGSQAALARMFGVTRAAVGTWWKGKAPISAERCPVVEAETRKRGHTVWCEELRPDVAWHILRAHPYRPEPWTDPEPQSKIKRPAKVKPTRLIVPKPPPKRKAMPKRANGGLARASKLTPERRAEIATKAARARWSATPPILKPRALTAEQIAEVRAAFDAQGFAAPQRRATDILGNK
jgi:DNA-binding transcriptional regulator YdaS (Cro superfamily)